MTIRKLTETRLVKASLEWLRLSFPRGVWWRANTGAVLSEYKGRTRLTRYGAPGMSDICGVYLGRAVFIEAKLPGRKLSDTQRAFAHKVVAAGAIYLVIHDLNELDAELRPRLPGEDLTKENDSDHRQES